AELPLFGRPGSHAEIRALIFLVESVKAWSDLDVAIGSGVERAPQFFPAVDVETRHVSPDTELTAGVSNQDVILHDDRGRGEGLAAIDVANPRSPRFLARLDVHGHHRRIEQAVDNLALGKRRAAVDDIAAGNAHRSRIRV